MKKIILLRAALLTGGVAWGATGAAGAQSVPARVAATAASPAPEGSNRIDILVYGPLITHRMAPSAVCTDDAFLRRTSLVLTGRLPNAEHVRAFLADKSAGKRARAIDSLLLTDACTEWFAMKWGDLLRIKSEFPSNLWPNAVQAYNRWIYVQVRDNRPYDKMVYELLTSSGSDFRVGPVNFYRAFQTRSPQAWNGMATLLFLGSRTADQKAEAFFTNIAFKNSKEWKEEFLYADPDKAMTDKRVTMGDGRTVEARAGTDLRIPYAAWLTSAENRQFARTIANRVWYWMMGRGIVDQPDDFRADNPPSNPELLDYLAGQMVACGFDIRAMMRMILNSDTYQRSSVSNDSNRGDEALFSHYKLQRLTAEALVDALCDITRVPDRYFSRVPEPYTFYPPDTRAVELGDGTVTDSELMLFGRPTRDVAYESDRRNGLDPMQVLYLINSSTINDKINSSPWLKELVKKYPSMERIAAELYLTVVGRYPDPKEKELAVAAAANTSNAVAAKDLLWALLNSPEFIFNR